MRVKALSWNVNGLRAAHRNGNFLTLLEAESPDILGIQEIKAQVDQLPAEVTQVPGYHAYFNPAQRKGYSGVAVYSKTEPLEVTAGLGIEEFDAEGRVLILRYPGFVLYNIYYPNGRMSDERLAFKMRFYDAFLQHANAMRDAGNRLLICGDVNTAHREIDLARPKENAQVSGFLAQEREWVDTFLSNGYLDTLRLFNQEAGQYSYWDMQSRARERNVGWRIDYFFVDEALRPAVQDAFILPQVMGSDHCPVGVVLEV
ncbi:MAG: exodeoxyribonuclease III [Chloroflexota bacterium]